MSGTLQWYDSEWLARYLQAKKIISVHAPSKLDDFEEALAPLRTHPSFQVKDVPAVLDAATLSEVRALAKSLPVSQLEMHEAKQFGRFVVHDHPRFTQIQIDLCAMVSRLVGEDVEPSYNFLSLYSRSGVCEPHLDAPSAKWTLDICIDQSEPWPIYFSQIVPWPENPVAADNWRSAIKSSGGLHFVEKTLSPGDAIIFSGSSQWHYRDAMPAMNAGSFCDLLFLHYIPKGMSELLQPRNWGRIFDVPELNAIPGIEMRA